MWSYTQAATYYYTISEVNNDESGYIYDTTVYTIIDLVTDADGQLEVTRTVTNASIEMRPFIKKHAATKRSYEKRVKEIELFMEKALKRDGERTKLA